MIELHCHTTASDGTLSPEALVEHAAALGLTHLAITDHDTTKGSLEAAPLCRERRITLIPAIEISSTYDGRSMDLLGYGIDPRDPELLKGLDAMVHRRLLRIPKMIERLRTAGVEVSEEEVYALAPDGVVGRPHVAQALVNRGVVADVAEAFEKYLARGRIGYVPKENLSPEEAIGLITEAGGVAVLAHPRYLNFTDDRLEAMLDRLTAAGLAGIEVYYSQHTEDDVERFAYIAAKRGLVATGGSDFHGSRKPHIRLGIGPQGRPLQKELAERLLERIESRKGRRPAEGAR